MLNSDVRTYDELAKMYNPESSLYICEHEGDEFPWVIESVLDTEYGSATVILEAYETEIEAQAGFRQLTALGDVLDERTRQDVKWGEQNHDPAWYLTILMEEIGEVAKEMLNAKFSGDGSKMRNELVQVAAVALAMVECHDRNTWDRPHVTARYRDWYLTFNAQRDSWEAQETPDGPIYGPFQFRNFVEEFIDRELKKKEYTATTYRGWLVGKVEELNDKFLVSPDSYWVYGPFDSISVAHLFIDEIEDNR